MVDSILTALYFAGLVAGSALRYAGVRAARRRGGQVVREQGTPADRLLMSLPFLGMFVAPILYAATPWLRWADYRLPTGARLGAGLAGAATFAAGLWLLWRSHADLGGQWSPTLELREEHKLITQGVYRHIRHPMYAAHWLWAAAQALLLHNWVAGPATLVTFLPLYLVRTPQEERMMLEEFGDEYRAYLERTGRVIPRFRRSRSAAKGEKCSPA